MELSIMPWPNSDEVVEYLQAAGLLSAPLSTLQNLINWDDRIASAIEEWNDITKYWPFLSTGETETVRYREPVGNRLDLDNGLLELVSLSIYADYSNTYGVAQTRDQMFKLFPLDAPRRKWPYTSIEFLQYFGGSWSQEILVEGVWGYCLDADLPKSARQALMSLVSLRALPQLLPAIAQGLLAWKSGDTSKRFASPKDARIGWQSDIDTAVVNFRRIRWSSL